MTVGDVIERLLSMDPEMPLELVWPTPYVARGEQVQGQGPVGRVTHSIGENNKTVVVLIADEAERQ